MQEWRERAERITNNVSQLTLRYPTSFGVWAMNIQNFVYALNEIAVVGKDPQKVLAGLLKEYIPNRIMQTSFVLNNSFPLFKGKAADEIVNIYLCKDYSCHKPVTTISALFKRLKILKCLTQ